MLIENTAVISRFTNLFSQTKKQAESEDLFLSELKNQLIEAKKELETAQINFNNVTGPKLIDVYIYKIQSEEARYEKILSEIKKLM